jgi:FMN phosphatase YigB (HAD superfamily)
MFKLAGRGNEHWNQTEETLIIFDLDGTLAESNAALDAEMAALLGVLRSIVKEVAR